MKIGVAIPCYHGHIENLFNLLDSIQSQTVLPDKVVVSCSSTKLVENKNVYTFPLEILICEEQKNAAQNRNIAASNLLDMDYITFIDADDIMHPERIEILLEVIKKEESDIILHNFYDETEYNDTIFNKIQMIHIRNNSLVQSWSGCITHRNGYYDYIDRIHHSQVTVKKTIFEKIQFPEEAEFHKKEDCVFCYRVFSLPNITNAYIQNKLSYYKPSRTGGCSFEC
jgi:glycosyltransferase involved in cell wall biosynthesis